MLHFMGACAVLVRAHSILAYYRSLIWLSSTAYGPVSALLIVAIFLIAIETAAALFLVSLVRTLYNLLPPFVAHIEPDNERFSIPHQEWHEDSMEELGLLSVCAQSTHPYAVSALFRGLEALYKSDELLDRFYKPLDIFYELLNICYDFAASKFEFLAANPLISLATFGPIIVLVMLAAAILVYGCFDVLCYYCVILPASAVWAISSRILQALIVRILRPAARAFLAKTDPRVIAGPTTPHHTAPDQDPNNDLLPQGSDLACNAVNTISNVMVVYDSSPRPVEQPEVNSPAHVSAIVTSPVRAPINTISKAVVIFDSSAQPVQRSEFSRPAHVLVKGVSLVRAPMNTFSKATVIYDSKDFSLVHTPINTISKAMVIYDSLPQLIRLPQGNSSSEQTPIHITADVLPTLPQEKPRASANSKWSIQTIAETEPVASQPQPRVPANTRSSIQTIAETTPISYQPQPRMPPNTLSIIQTIAETTPISSQPWPQVSTKMTMISQTGPGPFQTQASKLLRKYERGLKKGRSQTWKLAKAQVIRQRRSAQCKAKKAYNRGIARGEAQGFQQGISEREADSREKEATALWNGYALGFNEGEITGYRDGFKWGFNHGKEQGFHTGTAQGIETGRSLGRQEVMNIVAGANHSLVMLAQRWVEMYNLSNDGLLMETAIREPHGLDSNLPNTPVSTTQECTNHDHGRHISIDKGTLSYLAPSPVNAESLEEISQYTEDSPSTDNRFEAVTDLQPEKGSDLAAVNSMSSDRAISSVEAEKLHESSSDAEIVSPSDNHISAVSEFDPARLDTPVVNESQDHSDSKIASSSSLPLIRPPPQKSRSLNGPSSLQPLFGPGAVTSIPDVFIPGFRMQATKKPQTSSIASDATSSLVPGTRLEVPAGSSSSIPQSEFAPTLPSSHVALPSNVPTPQKSLFKLGDASIVVGANSAKLFQKAVPRITRSKLAGSCPQSTYVPPMSVMPTNDPSKAFMIAGFKPFGQTKTEKSSSCSSSMLTTPLVFVPSVPAQSLGNLLPPPGSKGGMLQPEKATSHVALSTAVATSSPAAQSVTSSPADTSIASGTAHPLDSATSRTALINAKTSSLINPSTKRGGKRVKAPRTNTGKDAKKTPTKDLETKEIPTSDHGGAE